MSSEISIGEKIKTYRKLKNMTQEDLSKESDLYLSTIKKYETDNRNPKLEQLEKIAAALDVSVFEFLDIEVKSISDIISLVNKMNNATEIEWDIDNEKVSISFKNENINNSLKDYALDYRCKDINIENESSDSEATLTRLMLINNSLK